MLGFAAAAALALALWLLELCLLSLLLPGVGWRLLPADVGLWCDVRLWKDRGDWGEGVGCWSHLPLCWPLWGVVLLTPPFVSPTPSFVAAAFAVGFGALGALLVTIVVVCCPLLFSRRLHEGVIHGGQVCHELIGDGAEGLCLSHSHGDVPRKGLPQRLDLGEFGGVSANQGDPPIAIFVDCFLGAELDEDPGPAHRVDAVLDHVEAPDVPVRWFFGDQLVFAVPQGACPGHPSCALRSRCPGR